MCPTENEIVNDGKHRTEIPLLTNPRNDLILANKWKDAV